MSSPVSFNIGYAKAHCTLKLIGLLLCQLANGMTTAKSPSTPAGLTALVSQQTALTNLMRGNELIVHEDDKHGIPPVNSQIPKSILWQDFRHAGSLYTSLICLKFASGIPVDRLLIVHERTREINFSRNSIRKCLWLPDGSIMICSSEIFYQCRYR
jgi:hypothetical protein